MEPRMVSLLIALFIGRAWGTSGRGASLNPEKCDIWKEGIEFFKNEFGFYDELSEILERNRVNGNSTSRSKS